MTGAALTRHGPAVRRVLTLFIALLFSNVGMAAAQRSGRSAPPRPSLGVDADTNNALAYYSYGLKVLATNPERSAAAFYWASRLDPAWAAPLLGQQASELLAIPPYLLTRYLTNNRESRQDPVIQRIDSLAYQAVNRNPFVDRSFDGIVLSTWLARATNNATTLRDLGHYDRRFTAWAAYTRGDYRMATKVFAEVIKTHPDDPDLLTYRALALFAQSEYDSARASVQQALSLQRQTEVDLPGVGWVSHSFGEYSVGFLFALAGQVDSAQAAYERALLEDIAFHPAHHQLGRARLAAADTARALAEFAEAVAIRPTDGLYLYDLGMLLIVSGQADSGATMLRRAVAAEPFFPLPHYTLGLVSEQSGFLEEALAHYSAFIALAPRTMAPAITAAQEHRAAIQRRQ